MGKDLTNSFEIAESGACKTGQGDAGVPETVSPNQYDGEYKSSSSTTLWAEYVSSSLLHSNDVGLE
jgi:hypothetical protein